MTYNPDIHHRRSIRLRDYDYSRAGAYFITICTHSCECLLGNLVDGEIRLNKYGDIARDEWLKTGEIRRDVLMDAFVIMPNHVHGIITITDHRRGTSRRAPTTEQFGKPVPNSIPTIVRLFKSASTKRINQSRNTPGARVWQRNYHEHVIRNDADLGRTREYIANNPRKWDMDSENPDNLRPPRHRQA